MTNQLSEYLGNFSACEPWAAIHMTCEPCKVSWTGCWDNCECPRCGKGELPWMEIFDTEESEME